MEELYNEGLIKAIGDSNYLPDRLMDLIVHNIIVPAVNRIETHPFYQQTETTAFLNKLGVQHQSWAPFAANYNKSIAQIALRWLVQREVVAIPKSVLSYHDPEVAKMMGNWKVDL